MASRSKENEIGLAPDTPVRANYERDFYSWLMEQAGFVRDGDHVQHRIGRATKCHVDGKGVAECLGSHDVERLDALFQQGHHLPAGILGQHDAPGFHGGDRAVTRQAQAQRLGEAVHCVCRKHP